MQLRLVPADVVALWYDDYPIRNFGREWVDKMAALCRERCADQDISGPLALAAAAGVGYVAARPFETREHYINIRYRKGDAPGLLVLRTTWLDHYWVMTDLSRAVGKKWMDVPQQRAKLYWSWTDRTQSFERGAFVGNVTLPGDQFQMLLWDDHRGRGILMLFASQSSGSPPLVAAEPVTVEKIKRSDAAVQYCWRSDGTQSVVHVQIGDKRAMLSATATKCQ